MCDPHQLFAQTLKQYNNDAKWDNAQFGAIKTIANTLVGDVGQDFIMNLCVSLGFPCVYPTDKNGKRLKRGPWDLRIGNAVAAPSLSKKAANLPEIGDFEIKTATEDVNGHFQFNHIRYHRDYGGLLCLGVSPNDLYFGLWTKAAVSTGLAGKLASMEKNANASYKLTKKPTDLHCITDFAKELAAYLGVQIPTVPASASPICLAQQVASTKLPQSAQPTCSMSQFLLDHRDENGNLVVTRSHTPQTPQPTKPTSSIDQFLLNHRDEDGNFVVGQNPTD